MDFTSGESGTLGRRTSALGALRDIVEDVGTLRRDRALRRAAALAPPQRVLAVSVARPERAGSAAIAARVLEHSHQEVDVRLVAPHPDAGKWQNINRLMQTTPLSGHDWLLIFDDDVVLPDDFLDPFLFLCGRFDLTLAQPAHRHWSHAAWRVTRRQPTSVARRTTFVEIGPLTAIAARAFDTLLPFPDLRMGWGLDAHWGAVAAQHGWRMGVVDATPIRHTRPVAGDYDREGAEAEARAFLADRPYVKAADANRTVERFARW